MPQSNSHEDAKRGSAAIASGRESVANIFAFAIIVSCINVLIALFNSFTALSYEPIYWILDEDVRRFVFASIRLLLTIGLCTYLYRGYQWARIVAIVLFFAAVVPGLWGMYATLVTRSPFLFAYLLVLTVGYGLSAYVLLVSRNVHRFLRHQRHLHDDARHSR